MPNYRLLNCTCGGVIVQLNRFKDSPECDECGKVYPWRSLKYDKILINDETGWRFPVLYKDRNIER